MLPLCRAMPHVQKAVCCASGAFDQFLSSYTYNGEGNAPANGRLNWADYPAAVKNCPIGKYSCKSVKNVSDGQHPRVIYLLWISTSLALQQQRFG